MLFRSIPAMAYSPIEQGRLSRHVKLRDFAKRHDMSATQAALAWLLHRDQVMVIPKTGNPERMRENAKAAEISLNKAALAELDALFPPPKGPVPLEML